MCTIYDFWCAKTNAQQKGHKNGGREVQIIVTISSPEPENTI